MISMAHVPRSARACVSFSPAYRRRRTDGATIGKAVEWGDDADCPISVLDVGRMHRQPDHVPLGVSDDMALAAFDLQRP